MLVASQQAVAVSITPTVDGTIRDGLYSPKDDVPDSVIEGSIVQGPFVAFNSLEYPPAANLIITTCPACQGDFDQDGDIDGSDPAVFAADFGRTDCPGALSMDLQWDLTIGSSFLAIWIKNSFPCMYLGCLLL